MECLRTSSTQETVSRNRYFISGPPGQPILNGCVQSSKLYDIPVETGPIKNQYPLSSVCYPQLDGALWGTPAVSGCQRIDKIHAQCCPIIHCRNS